MMRLGSLLDRWGASEQTCRRQVIEAALQSPPLASLAPNQSRPARDAAHALERGGVGSREPRPL